MVQKMACIFKTELTYSSDLPPKHVEVILFGLGPQNLDYCWARFSHKDFVDCDKAFWMGDGGSLLIGFEPEPMINGANSDNSDNTKQAI